MLQAFAFVMYNARIRDRLLHMAAVRFVQLVDAVVAFGRNDTHRGAAEPTASVTGFMPSALH